MVSIAGNTLIQIVTACAQELGSFEVFATTSLSGAANLVISSSLIDTEAVVGKYGGWYLWNFASAGTLLNQQNRVTRGGFAGVSGTFTTTRNFSGNPASGEPWLALGTMPMVDQDGLIGIRTCVNRMLRKAWTIYRYPITSTGSDVLSYDLGSLFWASKDRFKRLLDPDYGSTGYNAPSSNSWKIVVNADVWTLELGAGFPIGTVFYLECEIPLNARLYLSGSWANQSSVLAGMVIPADACLGEWDHVLQCSLYECMKQLAVQAGGNRKAYWEGRVAEQRAVVAAIKSYQMDSVELSLGEGPSERSGVSGVGDRGFFTGRWY